MKVLISGGLGFIGLNTAIELEKHGYSLILLDNLNPQIHGQIPVLNASVLSSPRVSVIRGDITDPAVLGPTLRDVDAVIHLAAETGTAQSMYQIAHYNRINSQGTAALLDLLANQPHKITKVVLASSRAIYGEGAYLCKPCGIVFPESRSAEALRAHQWELKCPNCGGDTQPIATPETSQLRPASVYAATKLAQEHLVRITCNALGISHVILRFQNVYGEGQSLKNPYTGILSIFSTRIRKGLDVPIFEDGLESRDFVHVSDAAKAIRLSVESRKAHGETLNVGSGKPTSVLDVAGVLAKALGLPAKVTITKQFRLGDVRHCYADLTLASRALGFQPSVTLEEGINRFAGWVRSQPAFPDGLDQANELLKKRKMMG